MYLHTKDAEYYIRKFSNITKELKNIECKTDYEKDYYSIFPDLKITEYKFFLPIAFIVLFIGINYVFRFVQFNSAIILFIIIFSAILFVAGILIQPKRPIFLFKGTNGFLILYTYYNKKELDVLSYKKLIFDKSLFLMRKVTDIYLNFKYSKTEYVFAWIDASFKYVQEVKGVFDKDNKDLKFKIYEFLTEVEEKWTNFLLPYVFDKFSENGWYKFVLYSDEVCGYIEIHKNKINIKYNSEEYAIDKDKIGKINFGKDSVEILGTDYKPNFLLSKGLAIQIPLNIILNADLFQKFLSILYLDKLLK